MRIRVVLQIAAVALVVVILAPVAPASAANLHAGRTWGDPAGNAYGVRADLTTPESQPTMYSGFISGWVSTSTVNGMWAQTGWDYVKGAGTPSSYVEGYHTGGVYYGYYVGQPMSAWNFTRAYEVRWNAAMWRFDLYIVGTYRDYSVVTGGAPLGVQCESESYDSRNKLNTPNFRTVQHADSLLTYWPFDSRGAWVEESTYYVPSKTYYYQYDTNWH